MTIENIPNDKQAKLFMSLDKNLSSIKRRNVSYIITTYSDDMAAITIQVSGRKGIVSNVLALHYNQLLLQWVLYSGKRKFTLITLSELSTIARSIVSQVSVLVNKI